MTVLSVATTPIGSGADVDSTTRDVPICRRRPETPPVTTGDVSRTASSREAMSILDPAPAVPIDPELSTMVDRCDSHIEVLGGVTATILALGGAQRLPPSRVGQPRARRRQEQAPGGHSPIATISWYRATCPGRSDK